MGVAEQMDGHGQPVRHGFRHRRLEGGATSATSWSRQRAEVIHHLAHRGLQAGEGEIAVLPALQRPGKVEALGIAAPRVGLDLRAARIAQPQKLRHLVEGLAQRIVDGGAEAVVAAHALDDLELGVPARDQQQQIGKCARFAAAARSAHGLRGG